MRFCDIRIYKEMELLKKYNRHCQRTTTYIYKDPRPRGFFVLKM
jgi:hypothetical protein